MNIPSLSNEGNTTREYFNPAVVEPPTSFWSRFKKKAELDTVPVIEDGKFLGLSEYLRNPDEKESRSLLDPAYTVLLKESVYEQKIITDYVYWKNRHLSPVSKVSKHIAHVSHRAKECLSAMTKTLLQKKVLTSVVLIGLIAGLPAIESFSYAQFSSLVLSISPDSLQFFESAWEWLVNLITGVVYGITALEHIRILPAVASTGIAAYAEEKWGESRINAIIELYTYLNPKQAYVPENDQVHRIQALVQQYFKEKLYPSEPAQISAIKLHFPNEGLLYQRIATEIMLTSSFLSEIEKFQDPNHPKTEIFLKHIVYSLTRLRAMIRCFHDDQREKLWKILKDQVGLDVRIQSIEKFIECPIDTFHKRQMLVPQQGIAKLFDKSRFNDLMTNRKVNVLFGGFVLACNQAYSIREILDLLLPSMIIASRADDDGFNLWQELLIAYVKDGNINEEDIQEAVDFDFDASSLLEDALSLYRQSPLALFKNLIQQLDSGASRIFKKIETDLGPLGIAFVQDQIQEILPDFDKLVETAIEETNKYEQGLKQIADESGASFETLQRLAALILITKPNSQTILDIKKSIDDNRETIAEKAQKIGLDPQKTVNFVEQIIEMRKKTFSMNASQEIQFLRLDIIAEFEAQNKSLTDTIIKLVYALIFSR